MRGAAASLLALAAGGWVLSGCVAVAVPMVAGAAVGKRSLGSRTSGDARKRNAAVPQDASGTVATLLPAGTTLPPPDGRADPNAAAPAGIQYLYGSGEAAAVSVQAWREVVRYVAGKMIARPGESVVLRDDATLAVPTFVSCGDKPFAAVFDVDETVLLNLGFEYAVTGGASVSDARWAEWERDGAGKVAAVPGAASALGALRTMGVTVIFNTNRSAANAAATEAAIDAAGLGPAKHDETLFLKGDDGGGSGKDARRATIATRFCVVAMGGDQLGDFSDLFNVGEAAAARRAAVLTAPLSTKWGAGWFMLPNPVYGSALQGTRDEIFPPETRWTPVP